MRKALAYLLITSILCFTACGSDAQIKYPEYSVVDNTALGCVELSYGGIIYRPFGVLPTKLRGTQIGIREGNPSTKIHEIKGYNSTEWIVEYLDVPMSGGDMIFKAVGVNEIPAELETHKEYDY